MPYPGSTDALTMTVDPYDGSTTVTVSIAPPDGGAPLVPSPVSTDGRHTWTVNPVYTQTGKWVATWTVTGTGAGITTQEIWVSAIPSPGVGVPWRPERWQVAAYVPRRTLVAAVDGGGNAVHMFDQSTQPPGSQVDLLISDACAWVSLAVGDVHTTLTSAASGVAAIRAAAMVELGYPDNRDDLSNGQQLLDQATAMRTDLARRQEVLTGTDVEDPAAHLMPVYSFPDPAPWGDYNFL